MINVDTNLIPVGKFYVAVSGGVDSIAAVDLLRRFNPGQVSIFHYNHKIRPQNEDMEAMVRKYAKDHDISIVVKSRPLDWKGTLTEADLHDLRKAAYKELDADVVLCHHLDDAVESYIMRMIEGNPEYVPIPTQTFFTMSNKRIYRPFLRTRKEDFKNYANFKNLNQYIVEDDTNARPSHCRRNYIRHSVVPMFSGMGLPKVVLKKFYL